MVAENHCGDTKLELVSYPKLTAHLDPNLAKNLISTQGTLDWDSSSLD